MKKQYIPLLVSLDIVLGLMLAGCGDLISDVVNAIAAEAVAVVEETEQEFQEPSSKAYTMVGSQQLSEHQVLSVLYLSWPQSYKAVSSLLGAPDARDNQADYYTMPNGNQLAILYSSSGMATGYTLGDSN
ncbi:MAG: hypothetical protein ACFB2W_28415 [Leptolyngbyaceae cyanobacterium]